MPSIGAAFQLCSASVSFPEATLVDSVQAILFLLSDNHIIKVGRVFFSVSEPEPWSRYILLEPEP